MKIISMFTAFVSLFFFGAAFASDCPNISGSYISDEGALIKYEQNDCQTLTRYAGVKTPYGTVSYHVDRIFSLNGVPVCSAHNACESVAISPSHIEYSLNFNGGVRTTEHGLCEQHGYQLSKDSQGNLIANFYVNNCRDGFQGNVRKTFYRN